MTPVWSPNVVSVALCSQAVDSRTMCVLTMWLRCCLASLCFCCCVQTSNITAACCSLTQRLLSLRMLLGTITHCAVLAMHLIHLESTTSVCYWAPACDATMQVVLLVDQSLQRQQQWDMACTQHGVAFYSAAARGTCAYFFANLQLHTYTPLASVLSLS